MNDRICNVDACERPIGKSGAKGFCSSHYQRFARTGDPLKSRLDFKCVECGEMCPATGPNQMVCATCKPIKAARYNKDWHDRNPEYSAVMNKSWRANNSEADRAYRERYRRENIDVIRERFKAWEAKNPRHSVEWTENNRERAREIVRRRRARLKMVETLQVTEHDIVRLLNRFGHRCAYCGESCSESYHIDHVLPVSVGGRNAIGNLVPACPRCNVSKSNWLLSEWRYRDRLSRPLKRRASTHFRLSA